MNLEILTNRIKNTGVIQKGDRIVLGLSGGPDSVCLFCALNSLKDELKLDIHCVHVNHGLRGESSDSDEAFVRSLCNRWNVPLRVVKINCEQLAKDRKISVEEAGRDARYEAFSDYAQELLTEERLAGKGVSSPNGDVASEEVLSEERLPDYGVSPDKGAARTGIKGGPRPKIAVAQNKDDQAETIIYRIIRGTGINGLKAMGHSSFLASGFEVIRPILGIEKKEIVGFLDNEGIPYCVDCTNNESLYARNKIRLEIIPKMESINSSAKGAIVRLGSIAAEYEDFLDKEANKIFDSVREVKYCPGSVDHIILPVKLFLGCHKVLSKKLIAKALIQVELRENVSYEHLEGVLGLLTSQNPSAQIDLPGGYVACRLYNNIGFFSPEFFSRTEEDLKMRISSLGKGESVTNDTMNATEESSKNSVSKGNSGDDFPGKGDYDFSKKSVEIFLSKKTLEERYGKGTEPVLRYRRPGDYIYLANGGRKTIKNLLIDDKVPRIMRDFVPILAVGSEVIWIGDVFGNTRGRVSHHFQFRNPEGEDWISIEILM